VNNIYWPKDVALKKHESISMLKSHVDLTLKQEEYNLSVQIKLCYRLTDFVPSFHLAAIVKLKEWELFVVLKVTRIKSKNSGRRFHFLKSEQRYVKCVFIHLDMIIRIMTIQQKKAIEVTAMHTEDATPVKTMKEPLSNVTEGSF
jgi:hypothetical protein